MTPEKRNVIPEGVISRCTPIGELVEINPRPDPAALRDDDLASFIPMKAITEETGRFSLEDRRVGDVRKGYASFKEGDVLFAKVTPCMENGKAAVVRGLTNGIGFGSTEFFVLRPKGGVLPEYVFHFLVQESFRQEAARNMTGAVGLRRVPKEFLATQTMPVPPLQDQRRIVAEIEKLFTRLDAGIAALRNVQAKLKRYRAAVLKAACEGRLFPSSFTPVSLQELITGLGQGWSPKCDLTRDPLPEEWAIITTTAVQPMKYVDNQGKPLASKFSPRPHLEIREGDLLMTRKGPRWRAGVTCLVRSTRSKLMLCDTVYRFRCDEERVFPSFLELALNSPHVVAEINKLKSGINESGVSLTHDKIGGVQIPLPPLSEQKRIVAEVERCLSVVAELEAVVSSNLQRAARLRQSILKKAFTGELAL